MGPTTEFVNALQVSIRDGISNTLGALVMETLLTLLKHPFQLYAEKPAELHRELYGIFGSPAETLEKMISKELFRKLNMHYPVANELGFETCINLARQDMATVRKEQLQV